MDIEKTVTQSIEEYEKEQQKLLKQRHKRLMKTYKQSLAEYNAQLKRQNGKCSICGQPPKRGRLLVVDHDHATGEIRALLCDMCNYGLGMFKDDPELMRTAAKYIEWYKSFSTGAKNSG